MKIWGINKSYPALGWFENFMGGHLNIGKHITIYGANAMSWAVNIRTKKYGYICFTLPTWGNIKRKRLYFYLSPNGTPWASTFYRGRDYRERALSILRYHRFGHNFKCAYGSDNHRALRQLNDSI